MPSIYSELKSIFEDRFVIEEVSGERTTVSRNKSQRYSILKLAKCTLIVSQKQKGSNSWSVSLKLLDPDGAEIWNHDYSPSKGNHYHELADGKKMDYHSKTKATVRSALDEMAIIVECFR